MFSEIMIVIFLAVIQGLTEFLPVSSSGHLVIAEAFLGTGDPSGSGSIIFEIAVHTGTLGAVLAVYRKKIAQLFISVAKTIDPRKETGQDEKNGMVYLGWILLGSLPAGLAGVLLKDRITSLFDSPSVASVLLVVTGIFLLLSKGRGGKAALNWKIVIIIGLAQAVAILPGCSRSGWTITAALLAGVGFEKAAEFSFLLSIPAILGALLLELLGSAFTLTPGSLFLILLGTAVAFISGFIALRLLIYLLKRGSFYRFSWYLLPAGALSLLYFYLSGR